MKKTPIDSLSTEISKMDIAKQLMLIFEMLGSTDDTSTSSVEYTKSYFVHYYAVSLETFNKWVEFFCPRIFNEEYKRKKKFTQEEAEYIFENLGKVNPKWFPPRFHQDLMNDIYEGQNWKKSKCYEELNIDLSNRFPGRNFRLNRIPPKLATQIIQEAGKVVPKLDIDQHEYYATKLSTFQKTISKYNQLTEHEMEVRRRDLRRLFSTPSEENEPDGI
jgi:hypothetical protein